MTLCDFAQPKPLPGQLAGRTFVLRLDDLPSKRPLQVKRAPWAIRRNVLRMQLEQEQIGHDRHRHRAFHPIGLFGDLILAQAHDGV